MAKNALRTHKKIFDRFSYRTKDAHPIFWRTKDAHAIFVRPSNQPCLYAKNQILCSRVLMQGAPKKVLGLEPANVCEEMQVIDGIVVQPSLGCYVDEEDNAVKMES